MVNTLRGFDLNPSKSKVNTDDINFTPKGISRVLDAEKIREQYREKKRKLADEGDAGRESKKLKVWFTATS
jgi:hypothetical protein